MSAHRFTSRTGACTIPSGGIVHEPVHEDAGGMHIVGVDLARGQHRLFDLRDGDARRHRHDGIEIALRRPELQVAGGVAARRRE